MKLEGRRTRPQLMLVAVVMTLAVMVAGGTALAGNKPVTVEAGNLVFTFNGGLSPKKLPKKKMAPITLTASGKIQAKDGTHPPALKEAVVETDKNGAVYVKGLPVCKSGQLQSRDTKAARKACPKAIIGGGHTTVEVQFPEQKPILVDSALTRLQRRHARRQDHLLHPRLLLGAGHRCDRDHGEDQEDPPRPLRAQVDRFDPEDRRRLGLGQERST